MFEHNAGAESNPVNLAEYARLARKRAEPSAWDFIAGGSDDERTLAANRAAFERWTLRPRILSGRDTVDVSVHLFGRTLASPLLVAPIGYQGLAHPAAEVATVQGAGAAHTAMVVSTMSNRTLEDLARAASAPLWFQLYCLKDPGLTLSLVRRAESAGYEALVITVDMPRMGRRERDLRNGFALPAHLRPSNLLMEASPELHRSQQGTSGVALHVGQLFDAALSWSTVERLKQQTALPVLLKGVLTREDAQRAASVGIDGIIVSNHGGRQLDGAPASLDVLPEVVEGAGGRCRILLDGGIRRGTDVLKARALGADAVLIGRPIMWGLIARGAEGVTDVLRLLRAELEQALALCGQSRWTEIDRSLVASAPPCGGGWSAPEEGL
ncbi:alpha-hydroxy acid oxidase [Myxococcus sp. AB036A]|uniref:alpha-hydroxy acid oxidase n=1 Tax=Myxococcus sp. AB036A TaxID=2562793 RepID=UPI0011464BFA|nr:alpha-hydroxy acid oxidase [Myxococcus sp. AB036A]